MGEEGDSGAEVTGGGGGGLESGETVVKGAVVCGGGCCGGGETPLSTSSTRFIELLLLAPETGLARSHPSVPLSSLETVVTPPETGTPETPFLTPPPTRCSRSSEETEPEEQEEPGREESET